MPSRAMPIGWDQRRLVSSRATLSIPRGTSNLRSSCCFRSDPGITRNITSVANSCMPSQVIAVQDHHNKLGTPGAFEDSWSKTMFLQRINKSSKFSVLLKSLLLLSASVSPFLFSISSTRLHAAAGGYHLVKKVLLGGDGGWDYFVADPVTHRIFIARGTHMMVVDPDGK